MGSFTGVGSYIGIGVLFAQAHAPWKFSDCLEGFATWFIGPATSVLGI